MTPCDFRKVANNLLAVADGKKLQFLNPKTSEYQDCFDSACPTVTVQFLATCRIKPEPVLRPWTEAEIAAECIRGTVLKSKSGAHMAPLCKIGGEFRIGTAVNARHLPEWLLESYVIAATGAPCGVIE